jgi:exopolysaccharide biosynthesis polyprenyl glycosylphosphotransferase
MAAGDVMAGNGVITSRGGDSVLVTDLRQVGAPVDDVVADRAPLRLYLLVGDLAALVAVWVPWTIGIGNSRIRDVVCSLVAVIVTVLVMRNLGLYQSRVCAQRSAEAVRTVTAVGIGTATFVALQWMAGNGRVSAFRALDAAAVAATVVLLVRWRFGRWLKARRSSGRFLRTVVLVGTNDDALALWTTLEGEPELGYRVGAVIGDQRPEAPWSDLPFSTDVEDIGNLASGVGANGVIVVGSALNVSGGGEVVEKALAAGLHLQVWPGLSGLASRRVRMAPVSGVPFLYIEPLRGISKWNEFAKRAMDLVGGTVLCLISLPLFLAAALLVKLEDRGPVVYRSTRIGRHGVPITVFKLRTMVPNAAQMVDAMAALNERKGGPLFKATNDPRITRIGRFLRQTSIDELPQLWNVINGTMSLVGPRPALPSEVEKFDAEFSRRHLMRPGITGLWQIEARDNPSFSAYRRLDLAYVDTWSIGLDLEILLTTAHSVFVRAAKPLARVVLRKREAPELPATVPVPVATTEAA